MADNVTIPLLKSNSYFTFTVKLEDTEKVKITVRWNETDKAFYMDIEGITFELDKKGLKLVGGTNILKQLAVDKLGGIFIIDINDTLTDPTFDSLGDTHQMLYITKENLETDFADFI